MVRRLSGVNGAPPRRGAGLWALVSDPVLPDYGGANVRGIVPALLAPRGAPRPAWLPGPAAAAPQVVLFVIDGPVRAQLHARLHLAPRLASMGGGLIPLTGRRALRRLKENIDVRAIAPGACASDMNRDARDHADAVSARIPSGRIGTAEDMAGAAIYLASRAGDYVVGSTLIVDGGVTHARG